MSARPLVSFEFFPPKTPEAEEKLWQAVTKLEPLAPRFVSVTYGAGGSTRERTHAAVARLRRDTRLEPAAHLTCIGASRHDVDHVAQRYWDAGIRHVVALRGDPPAGEGAYQPVRGGYARAAELVAGLKRIADFEISVAAYPEIHPEALSAAVDLDNLKRKIDAGAERAITQFFFDTPVFLRFLERARAAGITVPIVPGLLPVGNFAQVKKFATSCGATIPTHVGARFESLADDSQARVAAAIAFGTEQCRLLQTEGIQEFHFYTLNRADLVLGICDAIGVVAAAPAETL
jgi:methylenetetrahydrofolate reductase (NADPH)